jgi:hypothetical protein
MASSKGNRESSRQRADRFNDLIDGIDIAGLSELAKVDPQAAYMAAQQQEQELLQEQAAHQEQQQDMAAQPQQSSGEAGRPEDEIKTEKELALQAQLPFQKKLQNLQQVKMDIENTLRARQTPSPKPTSCG